MQFGGAEAGWPKRRMAPEVPEIPHAYNSLCQTSDGGRFGMTFAEALLSKHAGDFP